MRIKTQLLISIITFSIILVIIGASVAFTQVQITELNNQSVLTNEIQTGASNLNYISNNYFLYQDNSYITSWQTKFSTLSNEIATLNSSDPQQQALVNTVSRDMENLDSVFAGVTTFLSSALEMRVSVFYLVFKHNGIEWLCKYKPWLLILNSYLKIYRTKQTKLS